MDQRSKVGFVGLGMMGTPMATRLSEAEFELYLSDAQASREEEMLQALPGSRRLDEAVAGQLDVLITMLPNSAIVESVLLGQNGKGGWARKMPRGATVIDMSSSEPARSRELAGALAKLGLDYLDAPVSGGVARARTGKLAILVGGDEALLARWQPLLAQMGGHILHVGDAGAGHAAKALNNYVSATGLVATVEALQIARRFGIDPAVMTDVLNASSGRSNTSENKVKPFMLSGTYASGFALQLMNKDLKIAAALAQAVSYPMALGETSVAIWSEAAERSTPTTDHTEMYRLLDHDE